MITLRMQIAVMFLAMLMSPLVAHGESGPTLAVLYFDNNSGDRQMDSLSKGFADMLITDLSSSGQVTVVERDKLQALLDEAKLQRSTFFDPKTAVKIGKGLGASHVVTGAFITAQPKMRIDVRLIEIRTGVVVMASQVSGASNDIFNLEQELVTKFLKKLDKTFFPEDLPPTKVPTMKALLSYSDGLSLMDQGKHKEAALQLKNVVTMAPFFGLARLRHSEILARLELAKTQRIQVLDRSSKSLYANARAFIATHHNLASLDQTQAEQYLGYTVLLRHEVSAQLHTALAGRSKTKRIVPRKSPKRARQLIRRYDQIQQSLLAAMTVFGQRFSARPRSSLSDADESLAQELGLSYNASSVGKSTLRFLLRGRIEASGGLSNYVLLPAPADLELKSQKRALLLAKGLLVAAAKDRPTQLASSSASIHEVLALWHIERGRIEKGIAEYQKVLDQFPKFRQWEQFEKRIHRQLGLTHDSNVKKRKRYQKSLKSCNDMDFYVGHGQVLSQRMRAIGFAALPAMEKEVTRACSNAPGYPAIAKRLAISLALESAAFEDCDWFERYIAKWLALGGSTRSEAGYRKNYSSCPRKVEAP